MPAWIPHVRGFSPGELAENIPEAANQLGRDIGNGNVFYAGQDEAGVVDTLFGRADEAIGTGPVDDAIDWAFVGHAGDTVDAGGPALRDPLGFLESAASGAAGAAEGASNAAEIGFEHWRIVVFAALAAVVLWFIRPFIGLVGGEA
ncbi:hypothetical protein [Halobacterium litoreum]|uniref:Uncharacterized protein n=1 Tax=Halobacterium litoreum TaxID=2039234 RepID=A0ABD5N9X0_9EURY|nr:hypothetical protein [Halobacterium litoreum]UHH14872.1 hypothetical protein LT972_14795 [Halobacterium litoreum]